MAKVVVEDRGQVRVLRLNRPEVLNAIDGETAAMIEATIVGFAGGLELALWCDFRIAGEGAEFGVLNRRWGISLVDGGTQRLRSVLGVGNALYLLETGARVDAAWALRNGLVQEVVARGGALERALELAEQVASYPQASLLADRKGLLRAAGLDIGLRLEAELGYATLDDPETSSLLEAFARGDRPPSPRPPDG